MGFGVILAPQRLIGKSLLIKLQRKRPFLSPETVSIFQILKNKIGFQQTIHSKTLEKR